MQFFKDKGIKVVTVYPPATYTTMTTDRDDMEPVPEKEAQPSDVAKAAMLVSISFCIDVIYIDMISFLFHFSPMMLPRLQPCWYTSDSQIIHAS